MTELVVVERVLAQSTTGIIFSGRKASGDYVRVRVSQALKANPGEAYAVTGAEANYVDGAGRLWRQIEATAIQRERSSGRLLGPWLEQLPHLGPVRAQRLLAEFGEDLLDALSDPDGIDRIAAVIDPKRPALAQRIAAAVILQTTARKSDESIVIAEARFLQTLEDHGVTDRRAARQLWRLLGSADAQQRLLQNPYLAASLLTWKQADHLGLRLLADRSDVSDPSTHVDRLLGAIDSVWRGVLADGDTAISTADMRSQLQRRGVSADLALAAAAEAGLSRTRDGLLRAPGAAWVEDELARRLETLAKQPSRTHHLSLASVTNLVLEAERDAGFALTSEQREIILKLLGCSFGVLRGGAGVGKTAVTKVICEVWESLGGTCVLTALSGKAALQLSRGASSKHRPRMGYTSARLLRMLHMRTEMEGEGREPPADCPWIDAKTLLIVDEASMVDTPTWHELISQLVPGSQLIAVGDHGQLPSVGIGRVFHDLVDDGRHVATLNTVLRQAKESPIPHVAAAIRDGRMPDLESHAGQAAGIFLLPASEEERMTAWKQVYEKLCATHQQHNVMAIAALNASVDWLNQEAASTRRHGMGQPRLLRLGPFATVAVGDPVVCRQNRYSDALFNGMLGVITAIDTNDQVSVHWDGEDDSRQLSAEAAADIALGYAITCHKSQGSSAQVVVVLLDDTRLMTREWIYTAITRARGLVVLVGEPAVLRAAIDRRTKRTTGFALTTGAGSSHSHHC
jgi:exodeoxyribonuclease V alpha subunit